MRTPKTQAALLLLVCLSLGFSFVFPLFNKDFEAEGAILGYTVEGGGQSSTQVSNNIYGSSFTAGSNGNITSISAYGYKNSGTSINVSYGVYEYVSSTNAGSLLGSTYETKLTSGSGAWITLTMKAPVTIISGTNYYLMIYTGNGTGTTPNFRHYYTTTGASGRGVYVTSGLTYPTFLDPLTGESGVGRIYQIYATYTESGPATIPSSSVDAITPYWKKAADTITATATDAAGDNNVKNISLFYRYSTDNSSWGGYTNFGLDTASPWSWSFTFTNGSGYYQFYTIATDVDGNIESAPGSEDKYCGYDAVLPVSSVDVFSTYLTEESPFTINVTASDTGYSGLKEVSLWYRKSIDNSTWGSYTLVSSDTSSPWSWSFTFPDNRYYYEFYSISQDNATNSELSYSRNLGYTSVGTSTDNGNNLPYMAGSWFTAEGNSTISSISGYMAGSAAAGRNYKFGVYAWIANNNAGALLGQTADGYIISGTAAWYTLNLITPVDIVSGTNYFLVEFQGNSTPGYKGYYKNIAVTSAGIHHTSLTYPTLTSPLTGESGNNNRYSIYAPYTLWDRSLYFYQREWTNITDGYNTFSNVSSFKDITDGWSTFAHTPLWKNLSAGYNTFYAPRVWLNISTGWNTFYNVASWWDLESGWNTFGNLTYMIIADISPGNNETVTLNDFIFSITVEHTLGDTMNITWYKYVNGSWIAQGDSFIGVGNGTYQKDPSGWGFDLYNHSYSYRVTVDSSGGDSIDEVIVFATLPFSEGWMIEHMAFIILALLWVFLLVLGEWRDDPIYSVLCGGIGLGLVPIELLAFGINPYTIGLGLAWSVLNFYILILSILFLVRLIKRKGRRMR